jgi:hypothetical protein
MQPAIALAYWPDRTIEGWQDYFDYYCKTLNFADFFNLQAGLLRGFGGSFQAPEDDAYYVRTLWGEVWSPETRIKLRVPVEPGVALTLDPNLAFSESGGRLASWLGNEEHQEYRSFEPYLRLMPEFFRPLIVHVDKRAFDTNSYELRVKVSEGSPISIQKMKAITTRFIKMAHRQETGNPFYDERIRIGKQFYAMFDEVRDQLGEYSLLEAKTLAAVARGEES